MKQVGPSGLDSKADGDLAFVVSYLTTSMSAHHERSLEAPELLVSIFALLFNLRHYLFLLSLSFLLFLLQIITANFCTLSYHRILLSI